MEDSKEIQYQLRLVLDKLGVCNIGYGEVLAHAVKMQMRALAEGSFWSEGE